MLKPERRSDDAAQELMRLDFAEFAQSLADSAKALHDAADQLRKIEAAGPPQRDHGKQGTSKAGERPAEDNH